MTLNPNVHANDGGHLSDHDTLHAFYNTNAALSGFGGDGAATTVAHSDHAHSAYETQAHASATYETQSHATATFLAKGAALPGDGSDQTTALQAALSATDATVWLPAGKYKFTATLTVGAGSMLVLLPGAQLQPAMTDGSDAIKLDDGAGIVGLLGGFSPSITTSAGIFPQIGSVIGNVVTNVHHDGTQEACFLREVYIQPIGGTITALVNLTRIATNSSLQGCVLNGNGLATRCLVIDGCTEISVDNCWIFHPAQDAVYCTNASGSAPQDVWFRRCCIETWGDGYAGAHILGGQGIAFRDCHFENVNAHAVASYLLYVDSCPGLVVDTVSFFIPTPANYTGIYWTNSSGAQRAQIRNFASTSGGLSPILNDQGAPFAAYTLNSAAVSLYMQNSQGLTSDYPIFGDPIVALQSIAIKIKAGVPTDADFYHAIDGLLCLDSTDNRLYARVGGVWKYAALT